jgi:6-phosphofructokinase 1
MKRVGISTGGGDAPGLNAVIRAAVKTAIGDYGWEMFGIKNGLDGLFAPGGLEPLTADDVRGILPLGGTILGAANRGNPFSRSVIQDGQEVIEDASQDYIERIQLLGLDAMIMIGGDGTLGLAQELHERGIRVVGVPKTIDNDVSGTDATFGFDTAVNIAMEALDRLHTTAEAHHRVMVLELMGRDAGFITLRAGLAGGADVILIPEIPFLFEAVCRKVQQRISRGRKFSILAIAEGAHPQGEQKVYSRAGDELYVARLGGIGQVVGKFVETVCGAETRVTRLGHLQRGGTPTAFDRSLATRYGAEAVRMLARGEYGHMAALRRNDIVSVTLAEALAEPKRVDINGDAIRTARSIGISLGDEKHGDTP